MRRIITVGILLLCSACVTQTEVVSADFTQQRGVYIVGFSDDRALRMQLEDELATHLSEEGMIAFPSHFDISNITTSDRDTVADAAMRKNAISVLVINQVSIDASDSIIADPKRVSPLHPDLRAFFAHAVERSQELPDSQHRVFAEVNLFVLDHNRLQDGANLFWSGTMWSDVGDRRAEAVEDVSTRIAEQLALVRDQVQDVQ